MADLGFPKGGGKLQRWGANLLFCHFFPEIARKWKKFDWKRRGTCGSPRIPLDPPMNLRIAKPGSMYSLQLCCSLKLTHGFKNYVQFGFDEPRRLTLTLESTPNVLFNFTIGSDSWTNLTLLVLFRSIGGNCKGPFVGIFYLWWSPSFTSWTQCDSDNRNESLILASASVQKGPRTNGRNPDVLDWPTWRKAKQRYTRRRRSTERIRDVLLTILPVLLIDRSNRTPRTRTPSQSNCFHVYTLFGNNWPDNMLVFPHLGNHRSATGPLYTVYILYPNLEPLLETITFFLKNRGWCRIK